MFIFVRPKFHNCGFSAFYSVICFESRFLDVCFDVCLISLTNGFFEFCLNCL